MKYILPFLILLSSAYGYTGSGTEGTVNAGAKKIEQYGVEWTFDKTPVLADPNYATDYLCGQYANGDFWIYDEDGSVTITAISPARTQVTENSTLYYVDGSQIDPSDLNPGAAATGTKQGLDQRIGYWDASVSVVAPLTLTGLHSLITVKCWRVSDEGDSISPRPALYGGSFYPRPSTRYGAILTTVASIPSSGSFRPAFCGTTSKVTTHNVSALDTYIAAQPWPELSAVTTNYPTATQWAEYFRRPWIGQFVTAWNGEQLFPSENGGGVFGKSVSVGYGATGAARIGSGLMLLMCNSSTISAAQKRTLAIQLIQMGIDCYGVVIEGGGWGYIGGGFGQGRKCLILLAGICLDDADMKSIQTNYGETVDPTTNLLYFMEDTQKFYITSADIARYNTTATKVTRTNCSVDVSDRYILTDDDGGDWRISDAETLIVDSTQTSRLYDYWLEWKADTGGVEYVKLSGENPGGIGYDKLRLRHPVTPGTGQKARVTLFPAGREGYPDWAGAGGDGYDHWNHPEKDYYRRSYRIANTANSLVAHQLFALAIPTLDGLQTMEDLWDYPEFFDYMDHYMIFAADAYGFQTINRSANLWHGAMWDAYRPNYGDVWVEPTIGLIGNKEAIEGETVAFPVMDNDGYGTGTTDINGDALTFAIDATSEGKGMAINASTGAFEWITEEGDEGTHLVAVTVTNDAGRKAYQSFSIIVADGTPPALAEDPVLSPIGNMTFLMNTPITPIQLQATDVNGGDLTYSASGLPSGLSLSSAGILSGTPTNPGRKTVRFTVTDDTDRTDYEDVTIEVNNGTKPLLLKGS